MSEELPDLLGGPASEREAASRDCWPKVQIEYLSQTAPPPAAGLVRPGSLDELVAVARAAAAAGRAIVPVGAGSGVCGGIRPGPDDVLVDLKGLDHIDVRPEEGIVRCGAGAMGRHVEERVNLAGYTIGHFPSSISCSSAGGWVAARGAGQLSSRYGKIEDLCVGAVGVTADGRIVEARWGDRDLEEWIGSEGALVALAEVSFRLTPLRTGWTLRGLEAPDLGTALRIARELVRSRPAPSVLRVYDSLDTRIAMSGGKGGSTARLARLGLRAPRIARWSVATAFRKCLIVLGWEGRGPAQRAAMEAGLALAAAAGAEDLGEGPGEKWLAKRYAVSFKQMSVVAHGMFADTCEVACPWDQVETVYQSVFYGLGRAAMAMAHFSHAYSDGCAIYFSFSGWRDRYDEAWERILGAVQANGATLSHHHGVGRLKAPWMRGELGGLWPLMVETKERWDPEYRMNPGNLGLSPDAEPSSARPHPRRPGLDHENGLWTGPADATVGEIERSARKLGWTLGVEPEDEQAALEWLREGRAGPSSSRLGGARRRLVALSGTLADGAPFGSRVTPRTATGPGLMPAALETIEDLHQLTLRLTRRPTRWARLELSGEDALAQARALLQSDLEVWASALAPGRAELWYPIDGEAERVSLEGLAIADDAPPLDRQSQARWMFWSELSPTDTIVGADAAGGWRVEPEGSGADDAGQTPADDSDAGGEG